MRRPEGQDGKRPGNTELKDTRLHEADEQRLFPPLQTPDPVGRSALEGQRLSSTERGSGAETRPDMALRPAENTIFKPTRSGRVPKRTAFSESVMQLVTESKAVHLKEDESSSVGVPVPPFEGITIEEAMEGDAPE